MVPWVALIGHAMERLTRHLLHQAIEGWSDRQVIERDGNRRRSFGAFVLKKSVML